MEKETVTAEIDGALAVIEKPTKSVIALTFTKLALAGKESPKGATMHLLQLPPTVRAMALASAFEVSLQELPPNEATDGAEKLGRRAEMLLDEMPNGEMAATIAAMITEGDVEMILYMLKGNVGGVSTVAGHLTEDLLEELFRKDADLNRAALLRQEEIASGLMDEGGSEGNATKRMRTLNLVTTLLETPSPALLGFFDRNPVGVEVWGLMETLAKEGHEDASALVRRLKLMRAEQGEEEPSDE